MPADAVERLVVVSFDVPSLTSARESIDLGNVLNGEKGVCDLRFDTEKHRVSLRFDPAYNSGEALSRVITGTGYAVEQPA